MRSTRSSGVAFSDCTSIRFQLPATLRRCRSNAIIAAVVGAGLAGQAVGQPAFGPAADDSFDSKLTFKVTLSPALGGQTFNITMQGPTCVARSAPHAQAADPSGPMGSGACPGGAAGLIDDAGIGLPFPTGYNIGAGVDEVHTRMMNLVLNGSGWTLRAGAAAPTALPSYGEVESRGGAFGLGAGRR
ncbi:MAG: hypothetical protein IPK83_00990 [Planctomycetes bacterium]|nr:hypothetical protein [Planctomycetota bacterium]